MIPKFHWLLHYPGYLKRFGRLLSCWALERKHRAVKAYANATRCVREDNYSFERGCMREVTCHHLQEVASRAHFVLQPTLIDCVRANKKMHAELTRMIGVDGDYVTAPRCQISPQETAWVRDVVLYQKSATELGAGRVVVFCGLGSEAWAILEIWNLLDATGGYYSKWSLPRVPNRQIMLAGSILGACIHAVEDRCATLLHDPHF